MEQGHPLDEVGSKSYENMGIGSAEALEKPAPLSCRCINKRQSPPVRTGEDFFLNLNRGGLILDFHTTKSYKALYSQHRG